VEYLENIRVSFMQTIERFRLREAITAIHKEGTPHGFVTVPTGSIVTVAESIKDGKSPDSLVDIQWDQQVISVFLRDLRDRGEQVNENGVG
jgi:hypothetical protein